MKVIDLRRLLEEEDCQTSSLDLFKQKLSEIKSGNEFLLIVSNADAWYTLRNIGDELGYIVKKYWKEGSRDYRIQAIKR